MVGFLGVAGTLPVLRPATGSSGIDGVEWTSFPSWDGRDAVDIVGEGVGIGAGWG